ncbi:MAG: hypothetical protein ABIH65_03785 [Nanoarchaeota archaeon]
MSNSKYIYMGIIVILLALLFYFGYYKNSSSSAGSVISNSKVSQSDISFSNFKYERQGDLFFDYVPIHYNINNGQLEAEFSLIISTLRDDLYYRVYDAKRNTKINPNLVDYPQKLSVGDNKYYGYEGLYMNDLKDSPQIKVCVSKDFQFTIDSQGVVCKTQIFSSPEFKIEITPNPLVFTVTKPQENAYNSFESVNKIITIKNVGNIVAPSNFFVLNYQVQDPAYQTPKNYPQYFSKSTVQYSWLKPGEVYEEDLEVTVGNNFEFNTSLGTYETKGYVWGISKDDTISNALFKQEFIVKTIVNP